MGCQTRVIATGTEMHCATGQASAGPSGTQTQQAEPMPDAKAKAKGSKGAKGKRAASPQDQLQVHVLCHFVCNLNAAVRHFQLYTDRCISPLVKGVPILTPQSKVV